jgi:hypothetical protein
MQGPQGVVNDVLLGTEVADILEAPFFVQPRGRIVLEYCSRKAECCFEFLDGVDNFIFSLSEELTEGCDMGLRLVFAEGVFVFVSDVEEVLWRL